MTITHAFFDIGCVLGTNGWDRNDRKEAAEAFGLDLEEYQRHHEEVIRPLEEGVMTLDQYLDRTVFVRPRSFTPEDFKKFMYAQSKPFPETIAIARELAQTGRVHLSTASNEADELTRYRIRLFGLVGVFDTFLASCWLGVRKPAPDFYHRILAITAARAEDSVFIDDREENVAGAQALGLGVIHYQSADQLRRELGNAGLQLNTQTG
jgi:putative hydrolase of the HAD superfamily